MPRYFFHTHVGADVVADPVGTDLRDPDAAWTTARDTIRAMMAAPKRVLTAKKTEEAKPAEAKDGIKGTIHKPKTAPGTTSPSAPIAVAWSALRTTSAPARSTARTTERRLPEP